MASLSVWTVTDLGRGMIGEYRYTEVTDVFGQRTLLTYRIRDAVTNRVLGLYPDQVSYLQAWDVIDPKDTRCRTAPLFCADVFCEEE